MKENKVLIEQRLENMKKMYIKTEEMIDSLRKVVPDTVLTGIKDQVLYDTELKELIKSIDAHRPPRMFLIGRTGVGKSSLINAICGSYVAKVSDTKSCTASAINYKCTNNNRVYMEVLDTRGIAESESLDENTSAEEKLIDQIKEFSPDVAILMLSCTHRDDVDSDVAFLKKLAKDYAATNKTRLPIVVVINKSDEMAPARYKHPTEYPESKTNKIKEVVNYYKEIIVKMDLKIDEIIPVSSLIDWMTPDGLEVDVEYIDNLPKSDIDNILIGYDGRYNIEHLVDTLLEVIPDLEAQMGLRMVAQLNQVVRRLAHQLINVFAGLASTVAISPIPISDIYILFLLQSILVSFIAALSGREITLDSAKEFIFSLGGVAGLGFSLRLAAQQSTKLLNVIMPGSGSAISAGFAATGTIAIGKAAISYFIEENTIEDAKRAIDTTKHVSAVLSNS